MGFPKMNYMDPDAVGAPVQPLSVYGNFQNTSNDVKIKREGFIQARENMPNNTFIKLFNQKTGQGV